MNQSYQHLTSKRRWLITAATMSAALMQVLDMTIVNVALPHMQGSLSATSDQITWVLTSYLVSSAIFMPLTGYFSDRLGTKKYLLFSISGFVIASMLCGMANSIFGMVISRLLQGIFGAALVPLSQAILIDVFPVEERPKAMAIWGVGVMVGPILGPTLGGYLTEIASWRWNFYINLPIGILSLLIAWYALPNTPTRQRSMDWIGLLCITLAIGSLQYFLDRGNHADWFNSNEICLAAFLAVTGAIGFFINSYYQKEKNVFNISIFKDRNFVIASLLMALFGIGMFGGMVILPIMLENLLNYPVLIVGLILAPRGICGMISMAIVSRLIKKTEPRILIIIGLILSTLGTYPCLYYNLDTDIQWLIWPLLLQGLGMGFIFIPLSSVAFMSLPDNTRAEAAGLFSLIRTLGSSIGISIIITLFTRQTQIVWNELGGFIQLYNSTISTYLNHLHLKIQDSASIPLLANEVGRQAQMVSIVDTFSFMTLSFLLMIPLVFLIKRQHTSTVNQLVLE
ncbi:MAG: DHA2 family efflux MFS transporter permease subunit [Gammaproteobacteria bacterium]|nr:DHA2 family efflux MFS transporter permease subunit [Gammaproteobacteria bacterium]